MTTMVIPLQKPTVSLAQWTLLLICIGLHQQISCTEKSSTVKNTLTKYTGKIAWVAGVTGAIYLVQKWYKNRQADGTWNLVDAIYRRSPQGIAYWGIDSTTVNKPNAVYDNPHEMILPRAEAILSWLPPTMHTPLSAAITSALQARDDGHDEYKQNLRFIVRLVQAGANPNTMDRRYNGRFVWDASETLAHCIQKNDLAIVGLMLVNNLDPNTRNKFFCQECIPLLSGAIMLKRRKIAHTLLLAGADELQAANHITTYPDLLGEICPKMKASCLSPLATIKTDTKQAPFPQGIREIVGSYLTVAETQAFMRAIKENKKR